MEVTKTGQSYDGERGLACSAISVRLGDARLELPAHGANNSDYDHASAAGIPLDAGVFNYHHRNSAGYSVEHTATQDNIASKVAAKRAQHGPLLTVLTLEHPGDLTASGLGALHALQVRLGLPIITTVERNPMQGLDGLRAELEVFDRLETDQERFPTVSVRCEPGNFREKVRHIAQNYGGFNLQWGGYTENSASWIILSETLRDHDVWCNVVGILNRGVGVPAGKGKGMRTSSVVRPLLYGGHSYCFAWPHVHPTATTTGGGGAARQQGQRIELFNRGTWAYGSSRLDYSEARTRSFNAIQGALADARKEIAGGTLYSRLCSQAPGLRETLGQIPAVP